MKKVAKKVVLLLLTVIMVTSLAACGKSGNSKEVKDELYGTWTRTSELDGTITLKFDGKGGLSGEWDAGGWTSDIAGEYTINGNRVSIKLESWDAPEDCSFVINGDTLSINDTYSIVGGDFTKK